MFLMWLGEQITEKGIGNGISLIIFSGIVSSMPVAMASVLQQVKEGQMQALTLLVVVAVSHLGYWFRCVYRKSPKENSS